MKKSKQLAVDPCGPKIDEILKQEVVYSDYIKQKIEEGIKAAEEGRIVSHDRVKKLFTR
jgi:predicted transcriptional regulator